MQLQTRETVAMRYQVAVGLAVILAVAFGACREPEPTPAPRAASIPEPGKAPAPPSGKALPSAESPAPELDPALASVIEDISARWSRVPALRARVELVSNLMAGPAQGGSIEGQGVYEYLKQGETGLYRAEITLRFKMPGMDDDAPAGAPPPLPVPSPGASVKLVHVFDGKEVYLQNTINTPAPGLSPAPQTTVVIRGTPEEMGAYQLPGSFGPNPLAHYLREGWTLRLMPETTCEDRPAYVIEAKAPPDAAGIAASGSQLVSFDKETGALMMLVHFAGTEEAAATTTFKSLEFDAVIDPAHFVYQAPDGSVVREAREVAGMFQAMGAPVPGAAPLMAGPPALPASPTPPPQPPAAPASGESGA